MTTCLDAAPLRRRSAKRQVTITIARGIPTTVTMEPEFWEAIAQICRRYSVSRSELCRRIAANRDTARFPKLHAAVRVFTLSWYVRASAAALPHARILDLDDAITDAVGVGRRELE